MLRNFLFRIGMVLYWVICFPIWFVSAIFYWLFAICVFLALAFPAWLFFGNKGFDTLCKYIDLETYRTMLGLDTFNDVHITMWWFWIFLDKIKDAYRNNSTCKNFY